MPAISTVPEPLQPFDGQLIQIQVMACRHWRSGGDIRVATRPVPPAYAGLFKGRAVTGGLRAGEFIAVSNRTAADENHHVAQPGDGPGQSHTIMGYHEATLAELGASPQDSVKMEGYYFGTTREQWAPLAKARASHFAEPGPPATVVPCHRLYPEGAVTKIEVLAMREEWNGFDKYIPRGDSWPKRVWDWPIPVPYRQGSRLRGSIWTGGQVPFEVGFNGGKAAYPGDLVRQTRFTMRYVDDILAGFGKTSADLRLLVCYFTSDGREETTRRFLDAVADCVAGPLPPITCVAQPHMHSPDMTVEIWGVARG
jgi:enamine deaminase RidA (YjgF/YER057c/UK114 family)